MEKTLKKRKELHNALDELAVDFLLDNPKKWLTKISVMELFYWSYKQIEKEEEG